MLYSKTLNKYIQNIFGQIHGRENGFYMILSPPKQDGDEITIGGNVRNHIPVIVKNECWQRLTFVFNLNRLCNIDDVKNVSSKNILHTGLLPLGSG